MSNHNYIELISQHVHSQQHRKAIFNKTFFIAFVGPLISTIILFALYISGHPHPAPWINWLMVLIFVPLITASLVIGQRKELVGAYGETILILIPTFVWLLGGHDQAIKNLLLITFTVAMIGVLTYTLGLFRKNKVSQKAQKITQILFRLGFVSASVAATVVISIVLLDWADYSVKLAPIVGEGKEVHKDYTDTMWIMFIAIVTVLDAMLLVVLGLVSNYDRKIKTKTGKKLFARKQVQSRFIEKTIIINLKRPWYKRIFRRH